jgi:DNA-binding NtrC family response regulator
MMRDLDETSTLRGANAPHELHPPNPLRLEIVHSPDADAVGAAFPLASDGVVVLGRSVSEGFRIRDPKISRAHLRIVWDEGAGGFRYGDGATANGTFVNGFQVTTGLLLPGDVVRLGDTLLVAVDRDATAELAARITRAARSTLPVLVRGETGSGKELVARAIHVASGRSGRFVPTNCAALPPELAATELFGHTRNAFSGAATPRAGLFRAAEGGTILLDEIGDLPHELQGHLLRTLQERTVRPVGADHEIPIDTHVIAATHVDLQDAVRQGKFRSDLYSRLAHIVLDVSPLRARRSEILRLAREFAPELSLEPSAAEALLLWTWPGNVRELRAVLETHVAMGGAPVVRLSDLAERVPSVIRVLERRSPSEAPVSNVVERRKRLSELLRRHQGNISEVARELGKPRNQVYRWLRGFGLSRDDFR